MVRLTFGVVAVAFAMSMALIETESRKTPTKDIETYRNLEMATPIGRACETDRSKSLPFCDTDLPIDKRVENLVSLLTAREKVGLLGSNPTGDTCPLMDNGVARLDIGQYVYLVETNSGVSAVGAGEEKCSTTFPSNAAMAATFNRTSWTLKGEVMSTEMRSYYHSGVSRRDGFPVGLHGYGPNINIMRDPRWGRNSEVASEDPFLSGTFAKYMMQAMQQQDSNGYLKMHASVKHFTAYSVETNGMAFNAVINPQDLHETYLAGYKIAIQDNLAGGIMCSYSSINGIPACANALLNEIRASWNNTNLLVTTDCGALANTFNNVGNHYAKDPVDASALFVNGGTDLDTDGTYQSDDNLLRAIESGMVDEKALHDALFRVLYSRFRLGMFDPLDRQPFSHIQEINSTRSQQINIDASVQGLVLLQNPNLLPLRSGLHVAVIGPNAMSRLAMFADYKPDRICFDNTLECVPTIAEEIQRINVDGQTVIEPGMTSVQDGNETMMDEAVAKAKQADVAILCLGIDITMERESKDRDDIRLPQVQMDFFQKLVHADVAKKLLVVLFNGGALAIDEIAKNPHVSIVEAFYPGGQGGKALARAIFGKENRWGKLPYTIYSSDFLHQLEMNDMGISTGVGRTYKYYPYEPLFPFGFGLSYTTFQISHSEAKRLDTERIRLSLKITNTGEVAGDAVLLLYHGLVNRVSHPTPRKALIDFQRVHQLGSQQNRHLEFDIFVDDMKVYNQDGKRVLYAGKHRLIVCTGQHTDQSKGEAASTTVVHHVHLRPQTGLEIQ